MKHPDMYAKPVDYVEGSPGRGRGAHCERLATHEHKTREISHVENFIAASCRSPVAVVGFFFARRQRKNHEASHTMCSPSRDQSRSIHIHSSIFFISNPLPPTCSPCITRTGTLHKNSVVERFEIPISICECWIADPHTQKRTV